MDIWAIFHKAFKILKALALIYTIQLRLWVACLCKPCIVICHFSDLLQTVFKLWKNLFLLQSEHFTFVLTDGDGRRSFGYCRRYLVPVCLSFINHSKGSNLNNEILVELGILNQQPNVLTEEFDIVGLFRLQNVLFPAGWAAHLT
jgi:uDENN domain